MHVKGSGQDISYQVIEKAELGTFMDLVQYEVDAVESVQKVEAEDVVDSEEAGVAHVRYIFLSTWTAQRLISHRNYGDC